MTLSGRSYTVRPLTREDREAILRLNESSPKICGRLKYPEYDSIFSSVVENYLDEDSERQRIYGAFNEKGELSSVAGMRLWTQYPFWTLTNVKTSPEGTRLGIQHNGIADCVRAILKHTQSKGYFRFYYMFTVRGFTLKTRNSISPFQKAIPELQEYDIVTEAYIPEMTVPRYDYQWSIMGKQTYPYDVVIRAATLPERFRTKEMLIASRES